MAWLLSIASTNRLNCSKIFVPSNFAFVSPTGPRPSAINEAIQALARRRSSDSGK